MKIGIWFMKNYYVYILTNKTRSTFYVGVTNNIERRVNEHCMGLISSFKKKYKLWYLIYSEEYNNIYNAITREKQLKEWKRLWKLELIRKMNPELKTLYTSQNEIPNQVRDDSSR